MWISCPLNALSRPDLQLIPAHPARSVTFRLHLPETYPRTRRKDSTALQAHDNMPPRLAPMAPVQHGDRWRAARVGIGRGVGGAEASRRNGRAGRKAGSFVFHAPSRFR